MNWYEIWFDSPYYHILYGNRDEKEAEDLVKAITQKIALPASGKVLDLACGSGRFSYQLFLQQFETIGIDLSARSIGQAQEKYGHTHIKFIAHDMLQAFPENNFDAVFNFFTSFGYFEKKETLRVLDNIHEALRPSGLVFIDYLNIKKILPSLPNESLVQKEGVDFQITKKIEGEFLVKQIEVKDHTHLVVRNFEEKVYLLDLASFESLLTSSHFKIRNVFGNYHLDSFSEETSERLIILAEKV